MREINWLRNLKLIVYKLVILIALLLNEDHESDNKTHMVFFLKQGLLVLILEYERSFDSKILQYSFNYVL